MKEIIIQTVDNYKGNFAELIRCKNCKWYSKGSVCGVHVCMKEKYLLTEVKADDYCSEGEREEP